MYHHHHHHLPTASVTSTAISTAEPPPPSRNKNSAMEASIHAVEKILNYSFKNKKLLEEALTHSSCTDSVLNYQRLEFLGDSALGHAFTNYVFLAFPSLDPGQLSLLRAANISTEKLARVALKHQLFGFLKHSVTNLDDKIREFSDAVSQEDDAVAHGGAVKAPKVLADIVESVAAAVYVDVGFDLQRLWVIIRSLFEPIVTPEDLRQQPQPVTMLFEVCHKQGKEVDIIHWKKGVKSIASVYVDGRFIASGSSEQKDNAKINAAKGALHKLSHLLASNVGHFDDALKSIGGPFEIEEAKRKLHELCGKNKWSKPTYCIEKDKGLPHEKKFECSVQIATGDGVLYMMGDEKMRIKDAENSAASLMIRALQESNYL
ncbi:ribonuclease 3-like protein 2 [Mercurialis annua]|uniref:ribonuclease 3-like protein 2 n=1 Tax=Mercurialis annua TaxID=3986 RepID=UPI00215E1DB3|nr:ribonuclease 3-like protein 2 [Mercurialis annua]XP_050215536.1 ribonuclease 3-like protein 2 [Mercurialis annua]XP_050215537.1 ribonuclease 3-like protein 2 [Mercurialis annua]